MNRLEIFVDGASKGNPGDAGIGVVLLKDGVAVKTISQYIGTATNNVAEYTALVHGLQAAQALNADAISVFTDSQLMHRQLTGEYKLRSDSIRSVCEQARGLLAKFRCVELTHIPRERNRDADRLATEAVKNHIRGGM